LPKQDGKNFIALEVNPFHPGALKLPIREIRFHAVKLPTAIIGEKKEPVHLIVDVPTGQVVTNDFAQITIDLSTEWTAYHRPGAPALYPEHLRAEIDEVATTTWVTRRPPVFRDGPFDADHGRAVVAMVDERVRAGLPPESVVSVTGLVATPATIAASQRRLPMFDRITPEGVAWDDGRFVPADVILWCTGWRASLDHLAPLRLREPGGGIRMDGTRVVAEPRLHLVGYGPSASTVGANRAGRQAVKEIRELLRVPVRT